MKVTIALILAHGFPVPSSFVVGYSHLMQMTFTGKGNDILPDDRKVTACRSLFVHDFPIDFARNRACQLFLDKDDADYLLFLDVDMKHPPDLLHRLVAHDVDLVTARYVVRRPPFYSVAMVKTGPGHEEYKAVEKVLGPNITGLIPIDAGGAGALLIHRRVLEAVRAHVGADDWFRYQDSAAGFRSRSEDMWFFEQARNAGIQAYLDADLHCQHVAQWEVDHRDHLPFADALVKEQAKRPHLDLVEKAGYKEEASV